MEQSRKGDCKMKKFLTLLCMITCVFGLTACGSEEKFTEREQEKVDSAKKCAIEEVLPTLELFMNDENIKLGAYFAEAAPGGHPGYAIEEYTAEEIEKLIPEYFNFQTDGYAFLGAVTSFRSAKGEVGSIDQIPAWDSADVKAKIDGRQIIITVPVQGDKKNAEAEIIFTNDMFLALESAALNPISSFGEMMLKAALNTAIGMGTVFTVLVLICLIISCFGVIPKIQAAFSKKEEAAPGVDKGVAQIARQEEAVDEPDDLELVAVIAAAIAASEGAASTDGFVVRSIRRRLV